jgi:hypothetical protein
MQHPQKILCVSFVPDDQPAEVLKPSKQSLNLPAAAIASQSPQILRSVLSVAAMRSNPFNAVPAEFGVELVGVIGIVPDEILWGF